jgi:hypothetical protein
VLEDHRTKKGRAKVLHPPMPGPRFRETGLTTRTQEYHKSQQFGGFLVSDSQSYNGQCGDQNIARAVPKAIKLGAIGSYVK